MHDFGKYYVKSKYLVYVIPYFNSICIFWLLQSLSLQYDRSGNIGPMIIAEKQLLSLDGQCLLQFATDPTTFYFIMHKMPYSLTIICPTSINRWIFSLWTEGGIQFLLGLKITIYWVWKRLRLAQWQVHSSSWTLVICPTIIYEEPSKYQAPV